MMLKPTALAALALIAAASVARASDITGIWDQGPAQCAHSDISDSSTTITRTAIQVYEGGDCRIRHMTVKGDTYDIITLCKADELGNAAGTERWLLKGRGGPGGVLTGTVRYAGTKKSVPIRLHFCKGL